MSDYVKYLEFLLEGRLAAQALGKAIEIITRIERILARAKALIAIYIELYKQLAKVDEQFA